MKNIKLTARIALIIFATSILVSCANARWATNAGVDVTWGPNGPRVQPNIGFDVYNGGSLF